MKKAKMCPHEQLANEMLDDLDQVLRKYYPRIKESYDHFTAAMAALAQISSNLVAHSSDQIRTRAEWDHMFANCWEAQETHLDAAAKIAKKGKK